MFSRQEHRNSDQVICWRCEEAVHETALVCPYCNADIKRHPVQKATEAAKITPLPHVGPVVDQRQPHHDEEESPTHTLAFLGSLFLLLAGSALFFLAVLIALFSRGGSFTVSWPEHRWSAFFGLGMTLLALGAFLFQKVPGGQEEP
jgi:hypothetical protein